MSKNIRMRAGALADMSGLVGGGGGGSHDCDSPYAGISAAPEPGVRALDGVRSRG